MSNFVYIGTSLDGFIASPDGGLDWLDDVPNPDNSDFGYSEFIKKIDAVVMGRKTFEKVLTFAEWPYTLPVFVLSTTMNHIPDAYAGKARLISGNPKAIVAQLTATGFKNLYIDGGLTIQKFLEEDLIDELIITTLPVLLGSGIPLFGKLPKRLKFKLVKTEMLVSTLVKSYYKRIRYE